MAKTKQNTQKSGERKKNWRQVFRFMVIHDKSLKEVFTIRFTKLEASVYVGLLVLIIIAITTVIIFFTRVRELVPGYPDSYMRRSIVMNAILLDSLENELRMRDRYFENIRAIISGEEPDSFLLSSDTNTSMRQIEFTRSPEDSILRHQIEIEERFSLSLTEPVEINRDISGLFFVPPVQGIVVNSFNAAENHYGTDIVAPPRELVKATLDGTVIMAAWTLETGYVIQIQHDHDLVSVYKHNQELLKQTGNVVKAGDAIAIMGNLGEYSTGPHLHFELWHKGIPVDTEEYIAF